MKNTRPPALLILLILLLNFFYGAHAQTEAQARIRAALPVIDSIFRQYAAASHFPGFVYGLVVDGKLVHSARTGYINIDQKIPVSDTSAFRIASMSKSFTAMAILRLRDMGRLQLDDPASTYIPEMKGQKYLTSDSKPVTIRHLLSHEAGFPEDNPWGDRQLAVSDQTLQKLIREGISYSTIPGTGYEYSNLGFAMLGLIIKNVSGMPYQDFIEKNIWLPLGMKHTYWEYANVPPRSLAHGYRWLNGNWVEQPMLHDGAYGAMGGMITTMEDLSKYVAFHLSAWPPSDAPETGPVKRSSLREMQHPSSVPSLNANFKYPSGRICPMVAAYSFGLRWTKDCQGRVSVGHAGGLPGFGSQWTMLPDYGIGILSFSNLTYASAGYFNTKALDTLIQLASLKPRSLPVSAILKERQQQLMKLLPDWTNAPTSPIFAENFFLDYFPDSLRKESRSIFDRIGTIRKVHEMEPENNLRGSFLIEGEKGNARVHFTLTPERDPKVQEWGIALEE